MARDNRLGPRSAVLAAGVGAPLGCITVPPPDLPQLAPQAPAIVRDSVVPSPAVPYLLQWPTDDAFEVPVRIATPGETFVWEVLVDQVVVRNSPGALLAPDGGITLVKFALLPPTDPAVCPHRIDLVVAHAFDGQRPDSVGGDTVTWFYAVGGQNGCPPFDAGTGAFPDVSLDGLPFAGSEP